MIVLAGIMMNVSVVDSALVSLSDFLTVGKNIEMVEREVVFHYGLDAGLIGFD